MAYRSLINGSNFIDERGELSFFNTFDMGEIVRLYEIAPSNTNIIRAWQAHKIEKKWFYCTIGAFNVNLIILDNFDSPSKQLKPERVTLEAERPCILEISGGYATGFKALYEDSKLLVFSNFDVEQSKQDDFRFSPDYWQAEW